MKTMKVGAAHVDSGLAGKVGVTITLLQKVKPGGELYKRDERIEALLVSLAGLSREQLIQRSEIRQRTDPLYVPSECLLYLVRATRASSNEHWFERLYRLLIERVLRSLPKAENPDGKSFSLSREAVRDEVIGRFVELLATDRQMYVEKLDYFEIRFDGALASLRIDVQRKAYREENRLRPLEHDVESDGFVTNEVPGLADESSSLFQFTDNSYQLRLDAAIDGLPLQQRRIIHMIQQGFSIDSKDPDVMTIARALGRSEKTIRTHRDKALATLRLAMSGGGHR